MTLNTLFGGTLLNEPIPVTFGRMAKGIESGYFQPMVSDIIQ